MESREKYTVFDVDCRIFISRFQLCCVIRISHIFCKCLCPELISEIRTAGGNHHANEAALKLVKEEDEESEEEVMRSLQAQSPQISLQD